REPHAVLRRWGVLIHLVSNYFQRRRRMQPLPADYLCPAAPTAEQEQQFLESWRDDLLTQVWAALKAVEDQSGQPFFTVLRFRAEHPKASSEEMAEQLRELLGKPLTAAGVRQTLHRAREQFADRLLEYIAHG